MSGAGLEPAATGLKVRCTDSVNNNGIDICTGGGNPVTPTVTPESEIDHKKALIEALRGLDKDSLLEVLGEVLSDNGGKP